VPFLHQNFAVLKKPQSAAAAAEAVPSQAEFHAPNARMMYSGFGVCHLAFEVGGWCSLLRQETEWRWHLAASVVNTMQVR